MLKMLWMEWTEKQLMVGRFVSPWRNMVDQPISMIQDVSGVEADTGAEVEVLVGEVVVIHVIVIAEIVTLVIDDPLHAAEEEVDQDPDHQDAEDLDQEAHPDHPAITEEVHLNPNLPFALPPPDQLPALLLDLQVNHLVDPDLDHVPDRKVCQEVQVNRDKCIS